MKKIVIRDPEGLEKKIEKMVADGPEKLHVRSNFDGTLTLSYRKGKKIPSIISRLRQSEDYISKDYAERAQKLADIYRPIEYDPAVDLETKRAKMLEWWSKHYDLLKEVGLNKDVLNKLIESEIADFRVGVKEFTDLLYANGIPMIIMSSSGIGNAIRFFLEKEGLLHSNMSILTNEILFDEKGVMTGVKEPIIHTYNKNELSISELPNYEEIEKRKNILLVGDVIGDLGMTEGFDYDELITVGFLSEDVDKNLPEYKERFDVVILDDYNMQYANDILKKIINAKSKKEARFSSYLFLS